MKRIIITVSVCLAIAVFGIQTGNAAEQLKNCGNLDPMFIDIGDIIDCGIVGIGDDRNFKFDASAGDKIRLTMTDRTSGSPAPYLGLYDPDDVLISYWYVQDSGSHNDYSLTTTGEYTIVVWEYADNEAVDFRIALQGITPSPAEARTLSLDSQLDGDIEPFADSDVFIFDGTSGDKIRLTMTDMTSDSPAPYLGLYDPDGVLISYWYVQDSGSHNDYSLTKTGRYTIVVWEYADNEAVDFRIALQGIIPSPPGGLTLCHDKQFEDDIDPFADSDVFIFEGKIDDKIRLTMTDMTSGSPAPYLGLYDPDGVLISYWYVQDSGSHNDYSLNKNGRYTVVVWEYADNEAVTYRLGFNCISGECFECPDLFLDVPLDYWAAPFIYKLYEAGITGGCSQNPLLYCPENPVTRAQMAVFLLSSKYGSDYTPPPATGIFDDVPAGSSFADWIEDLFNRGITGGCDTNPLRYCPDNPVTRAQMAVFLLSGKYGSDYTPPPATGIFDDVPAGSSFADWIEDLFNRGITGGCSQDPLLYCPDSSVTRASMAVFLVVTFEL